MVDRPWVTALEMQFAALRATHNIRRSEKLQRFVDFQAHTELALQQAEAYAWSPESVTAVCLAAKTVPATTRCSFDLLSSPIMWWWFDQVLPVSTTHPDWKDEDIGIHAVMISQSQDEFVDTIGLTITTFGLLDGKTPFASAAWLWSLDEPFSSLIERLKKKEWTWIDAPYLTRIIIAACSWLQQRILTIGSGAVERHRRKQLAREHHVPVPSDVKVIRLRRLESSPRQAMTSEVVDWSCRWIVNGHWRNQIYTNHEHKLIYILPYVKGPDDKPLRVPTHTVYQVDR